MFRSGLLLAAFFGVLLLGQSLHADAKEGEKNTDGWKEQVNEEGQQVQQLKVEAPMMTEEDQHGYNMPDRYRCDACKAVVFHLNRALQHKQPKNRRMKEWEYTDLFDDSCATDFDGYGVKWLDGQNVLSGPGLKQVDDLAAGGASIQMGGENWSKRMGEICRKFVYEKVGEDDLYEKFHKAGELDQAICLKDTRDCREGSSQQSPPVKAAKKVEKKEAAKEKRDKKEKKKEKNILKEASILKEKKILKDQPAATAPSLPGSTNRPVDVTTFLTKLAVEHGSPANEYTMHRSTKEWERLVVQLASRIFERRSQAEELDL